MEGVGVSARHRDQTYTTTEFRRDLAACTAGGAVNEECMKGRGWVMVIPASTKEP